MGQTTSTQNTMTNITNTAIDTAAKALTRCMIKAEQKQTLKVGSQVGIGNKRTIRQAMKMIVNVNCDQKAKVDNEIQTAILNSIKQQAETTGTDIGMFGTNAAEVDTTIMNNIKASVSVDNVVELINEQRQSQSLQVGSQLGIGNIDDISQDMTADVFIKGLQDAIMNNKFISNFASEVDQKTSAETKSTLVGVVDSVMSMVKTLGSGWIIFLIVVVIVGGVGAIFFLKIFFGGGDDDDDDYYDPAEADDDDDDNDRKINRLNALADLVRPALSTSQVEKQLTQTLKQRSNEQIPLALPLYYSNLPNSIKSNDYGSLPKGWRERKPDDMDIDQ